MKPILQAIHAFTLHCLHAYDPIHYSKIYGEGKESNIEREMEIENEIERERERERE